MENKSKTTESVQGASYRNPTWWSEKHTSAWDRVRDAFQRDWEQTKADFSLEGGQELNQNLGDTVRQAIGSAPIPLPGEKTPTDPKEAAKVAAKAHEELIDASAKADKTALKASAAIADERAKLIEKVAEVRRDAAKERDRASHDLGETRQAAIEKIAGAERSAAAKVAVAQQSATAKIAGAQDAAAEEIHNQHEKVAESGAKRDEFAAKWRQAEQEGRYGYALRMQHPTEEWNEALERSLRTDWSSLETGKSWDESRVGIRRGWDRARGSL